MPAVGDLSAALVQTPVQTSAYTAKPFEFVRTDTSGGSFTVTLPLAPAANTTIGIKQVTTSGSNLTTVACSGSDVFNKYGGATTLTLTLTAQGATVSYRSGVWLIVSDDLPLAQLDTRYATASAADFAPTGLTGAKAASRYAGATAGGAPATGTFAAGDFVIDETGSLWICTVAGSPGTWAQLSGNAGPLATQTLGSPAASITFTSIPQTYSQLRLVAVGASNTAAENTRWQVRVNGDSGSNYDNQMVQGVNAAANAGPINTTQQWIIFDSGSVQQDLPGANATTGVAGILEVVIPGYSGTTFHKIGMWRSGYSDAATAAADASVSLGTVAWRSTAAITSITISAAAGSFAAGTSAYLYAS